MNLNVNPAVLPVSTQKASPVGGGSGFADLLGDMVSKVNGMQSEANEALNDVVTGKVTNIHEVSVKMQEAGVAFDLMLGVRNRLMQAFTELSKIQV